VTIRQVRRRIPLPQEVAEVNDDLPDLMVDSDSDSDEVDGGSSTRFTARQFILLDEPQRLVIQKVVFLDQRYTALCNHWYKRVQDNQSWVLGSKILSNPERGIALVFHKDDTEKFYKLHARKVVEYIRKGTPRCIL